MEPASPDTACSETDSDHCIDHQLGIHDVLQFQTIVEAIASAVFIFQADKLCYVNPAAQSMSGYSEDELLSMPFWSIIHEDFQDIVKQRGRARQAGDDIPASYDVKIVRKDGEIRWVNFRASMIELGGKPAVLGLAEDVSDRIQNDDRLKQYKHQQNVVNTLGLDALTGVDLDDLFQKTTELIIETLGVDLCKVLELQLGGKAMLLRAGVGWKPGLVGHATVGTELESQAGYTLKSHHPVIVKDLHTEARFIGPSLLRNHGVISGISVIIGSIDQPWGVLACHSKVRRDFSEDDVRFIQMLANTLSLAIERKQVEQALQESGVNFRNLADSDFNALVVHRNFHLLYANVAAQQIFEAVSPEHKLGESVLDYVHPRFRNFARLSVNRVIRRNEAIPPVEIQALTPCGKVLDIEIASTPVHFDGSPAVLSIVHDITERKQAEEALRENRTKLAEAQHIGHMGNWEFDVVRDTGWFSDETYRIFGVESDYGGSFKSFFRLVHPEDRWLVKQTNRKTMDTGSFSNIQYRIVHPDGSVCFVQANGECQRDNSGRPCRIFGTIQDITDRKLAGELAHKLSQAVDQAGGSIMITNKTGIIEYINSAFTKITGYSTEEVIGQTPRLLKSGHQDAAFYENMWKIIASGNVWHGKVIDRRKDGSFFPAMLTIAPIVNDKGVITHFVGSHADISELEDMENKFHQAQKMEAIGTLAGGIAHDFNNMLAGITGNIYLARKQVQAQPDVLQKLTNVEQISMRAAEMIQQLLTFARKSRVNIKPMSFIPFFKGMLKLLRSSVPENITIEQHLCADLLQIRGDGILLHQVMMNLLTNACDALEGIGTPRIIIRLEAFHADRDFVKKRTYFNTGSYAHMSVEDNGCGIAKEQLKHLFEPFFTTKEQGKGTGLGLAMVFGAVKTHHGFIEVDSIPGEGSTFHIYVPLLEQEGLDSELPQERVLSEHGRGETILLADDQELVLGIGREVLEALGYKVLTASNGQQAVEVFETCAEEIDLCIFDIIMPVMDGSQAARCIRQIKPQAKIIFSTGYDKLTQNDMEHETVINKPFSIEKMSRLIRQKLDDVAHELG